MLKSCSKCGRVHEYGQCPNAPEKKYYARKKLNEADKFRRTSEWQRKREEILDRDKHMCRVCLAGTYPIGTRAINAEKVQVHHITPIMTDWSRRLDEYNLITLCSYHHYLAEHGLIGEEELRQLAKVSPLMNFERIFNNP